MSDLAEKKIQTFFQKYLKDITQFVDVAKLKAVEQAARMCSIFGQNGSTPEIFAQAIYKEFEQTYNESFNKSNAQPKIEQWINAIFKEYRWNDNKSLFPEKMLDKYPKLKNWNLPYGQNLALADQRTKEFLAKSDYMYLGKYVSGEDTEVRMRKWLEQRYIERGIGIGNNPEAIAKFKTEFKELANLEDYKVRRIIDTSVSNTRTFGHLRALSHAGAETFKIAGPNDNLTCPWCRNMVGREFNVKKSVSRMEAAIDAGPTYLPISKPFLTSKYKSDDLKDVDSADIQGAGVELPPYHCSCRHRIVLASVSDGSVVIESNKTIPRAYNSNDAFKMQKDYEKQLTKEELSSLKDYTDITYREINKGLIKYPVDLSGMPDKLKNTIMNIDSALDKSPSLYDGVVYRGVSFSHKDEVDRYLKDLKVSKKIDIKTFLSTSTEKDNADFFAKMEKHQILLEIKTKNGIYLENISLHPKEKEVLIKRKATFIVESVEDEQIPTGSRHKIILREII